jgi:outer membrane protein assembly factor BamA
MVATSEINGSLPFVCCEATSIGASSSSQGLGARRPHGLSDPNRRGILNREGYFDSKVHVSSSTTTGAEPNISRAIEVDVDTGRALLIREIKVAGDAVLNDDDLATFRHHWFFFFFEQRFRPAAFEETVDALTDRLRARGYPEAVVRGSFKADVPAGAVDVELNVDSGPKVELVFNGNRVLSDESLLPLATFQKAGSIDAIELEATAQAVRKRYQERGFYAVQVEPSAATRGKRATRVSLDITEGPRAFLSELSFIGNHHLSVSDLGRRIDLYLRTAGLLVSCAWVVSGRPRRQGSWPCIRRSALARPR